MNRHDDTRPGSAGEHELQERYGTFKRAAAFYDKQMLDHLNPLMREYLARQEMVFIATADANGECDASFRAGPPGFVRVLDERTVMYPEYRGNGVMASLGNISENGHVGMVFVDFFQTGVGLHINGRATIVEHHAVEAFAPVLARMAGVEQLGDDIVSGKKKTPEHWVLVDIVEAYIHCSKHIPILAQLPGEAGYAPGSGDHFKAKDEPRPWTQPTTAEPTAAPAVDEPVPTEPQPWVPVAAGVESLVADGALVVADEPERLVDDVAVAVADEPAPGPAPRRESGLEDLDTLLPPAWSAPAPRVAHPAPARRARRPWSRLR